MQPSYAQPNATSLSEDVVLSIVSALAPDASPGQIGVSHTDVHSNDLATARLADGRTLVVKRGRYEWCAQRFEASRRASALLRGAGIVAPAPLNLPEQQDKRPLEAYWRIDLPILDELWHSVDEESRAEVLKSLGELTRRMHDVVLPGFGPLGSEGGVESSLASIVEADLVGRLLPAAYDQWSDGAAIIECLVEAVPELERRTAERQATLVHNDLHMGNILCEVSDGAVRCVGLLDLESATGGIPESDFAMMQLLHGPMFHRPIPGAWFAEVWQGYRGELDPWVLRFFRVLHLSNLGFYSAMIGHQWHAGEVAREAAHEVRMLDHGPQLAVSLPG